MPAFPLLLSVLEAGDEEVPDELPARTRRCASAGVKIDFSQVSRKRASSSWNREAMVGVSMSVSAMSYPMADSIKDTIPNVLERFGIWRTSFAKQRRTAWFCARMKRANTCLKPDAISMNCFDWLDRQRRLVRRDLEPRPRLLLRSHLASNFRSVCFATSFSGLQVCR